MTVQFPILPADNTEHQLKDSERELLTIFNASPAAMSVSDPDRSYVNVRVNDAWISQFGYTRESAIGRNGVAIGIWKASEDRKRFLAELDSTGKVVALEAWMYRADGSELLCRHSGQLIEIDGRRFLVMVLEEITEQRRIENEIRELNSQLETRVRLRTEALERAKNELERTLEHLTATQSELVRSEKQAALGRLVAGVAHELNTPLGNCLMAATAFRDQLGDFRKSTADGLKRSAFEAFLADAEMASDIVVRNLERGASLVKSFKRLAVDQSSVHYQLFVLAEKVDEILTSLHSTLKRNSYLVETDIPDDIELDSDPGALKQVLTNLINNAVLHGFEGRDRGLIRISAALNEERQLHLVVSDDGKGMSSDVLTHVFDPFFTTKFGEGSSGLGLHIVHNSVTGILGGKIKVDSSPDNGTRFDMFIPLVPPISDNSRE